MFKSKNLEQKSEKNPLGMHSNLVIMKLKGDTELLHYIHYFVIPTTAYMQYLPFGCENFNAQIR